MDNGLAAPAFKTVDGIRSALAADPDGEWVQLVVAPNAPKETYGRLEIGIAANDLEKSRLFYRTFVGLEELPPDDPILFLEIRPADASDFANVLHVRGAQVTDYRVLRCSSPAIPNAMAGLLLDLRDRTGSIPHAYFGWTEGNPLAYLLKFLALGEGDTAPVCREVLRKAEPNPEIRPRIHVG